ncbi:tRNA uridine-5-carboxymethylaminomethyl(34) synthesis GTPase MnmE [Halovulum dunhuangense]|uniref:tRNA modification GTPase MnmE n=1 Tax=Halovulum dunhuangense TaxID=1505036 RepID=A0A849KYZ5_9RHOB|nr:tRNA uridine-5-carboxymethylaminomethyl(34) synthesis GTPase MnmE [Halovulum dunhuangense]NNU79092.1 tRNA uridine-5-carboxymethylaminomethyl(34) synthesis GTPase MnmE [Halovulum dunhuangense]
MDTIFALSTVRGRAGVAVIRVSGPQAHVAAARICGTLPDERRAGLRLLRDCDRDEVLDEALVLVFGSERSFTGEKIVEFQVHGSIAVQDALLDVLARQPGLRLADPGEFTRRALENGRLDLTQVEGLADLLDAETAFQRRQALRVMQGSLGDRCAGWRGALLRALALLEATIDFADEELPGDLLTEVQGHLHGVVDDLDRQLKGAQAAERMREGFEVAIVGRPNVGKSTLLNALAGREAAITSEIAGTTRDVIEVRMDISGLPVTLLDTAGIRDSDDPVETLGIERARKRAAQADLRVFLVDGPELPTEFRDLHQGQDLAFHAKGDLANGPFIHPVLSGKTGQGLDLLTQAISVALQGRVSGASDAIRLRHKVAMETARGHLCTALAHLSQGQEASELAAEDVRLGVRYLDALVGRIDVESLLDEIFTSFCLGK